MIAKLIGKHKIKAVIIDPPYCVQAVENKRDFQKLLKDKIIENYHFTLKKSY